MLTAAVLNTKISEVENKIPDTSSLVTVTVLNTKLGEVESKIHDHAKKTTTFWHLFMDGVQLPKGWSHFEGAVYFLPLSSQKFLVLILSTLKG